ncbi:hypothetical protein C789_4463 [Microcystis aeruginosa FACHB-905 = DIANCHI905]|uniref:Tc1-like transposase DDE domain-containing protein n=2 Tax=Microcystis aeruginosa (strain PCC 7806) TaxID=267872 RepID=A8Y9L0_MICA7|nr:hypothetical protein BH695_5281 [Microcystis aeruginosa PCC 7806SL]ELS45741.1 hypothetical protein C789_4463 [Microcystis aeruginosa FACHB-905 = DIANCHI905]CAO87865.1 unnamed protein product [Microcystis aeruginosa PCC 7806]CAO89679.1 unnamed protein product [Microcystis aeruginosa PCC 7806]
MSELTLFSQAFSEELHIIQLDNASAPTATDLDIPNNFILFYQPPYCPKVNPNERVWLYFWTSPLTKGHNLCCRRD